MAEPTSPAEEVHSDHSDDDDIESVSSSLLAVATSNPVISPRASPAPQSSQPPRLIDEIERLLLDHEPEHQDTNVDNQSMPVLSVVYGICIFPGIQFAAIMFYFAHTPQMSAYSSLSSSPAIADVEVGTDIDMSGHFFSFHGLSTSKQQLFCSMVHGQLPWTQLLSVHF
ncbi:hypothetical protein C8J57DRAFT_1235465 [Mycena rebaudengoi]|nr:hypothetical protein C8J57DRAFT_1235465 [Mycena rebaudengoi]